MDGGGCYGDVEKGLEFGYVVTVKLMGFVVRLDIGVLEKSV